MTDLSTISIDDFEPCLGQTFRVTHESAGEIELELIEVKPLGSADSKAQARQSFSLLFRGPLQPMLEQQVLKIENSTLGELALFLVPIGPDDNGMLYDITFN
jgi:hypothetical protein